MGPARAAHSSSPGPTSAPGATNTVEAQPPAAPELVPDPPELTVPVPAGPMRSGVPSALNSLLKHHPQVSEVSDIPSVTDSYQVVAPC